MIRYHFDLYPRDDPKDGARLVRFTKLQSMEYRGEANGVGAGRFSIRGDDAEAQFIDPRGLQYVRVVEEGATEEERVIGGFWLENGDFGALTERGTRLLTFGGPGTIAYLGREVLWSRAYLYADDNIIDGTTWHFYTQPSIAGGDYLGAVLWRVMAEAQSWASPVVEVDDKPDTAIPESSTSFGQFNDSAANLWTVPSGEFKAQVGENILTIVKRLMEAGLYIEANPDTFVLNAWERGATSSRGQDKTGASWATDVIRFQAPTDGTIATGNVKSDATRGVTPFIIASTVLAGDQGVYAAESTALDVKWHRHYASSVSNTDTLSYMADAQLEARGDAADTLRLRMKIGTDPTAGEYIPLSDYEPSGSEPNGSVMLNDLVTVHTGTGEWDYNEDTFPVSAVTITLRAGGDWDCWVDLGSTYTSMAERAFQAKGVPTHSHPPNPELCGRTTYALDITVDAIPQQGVTRVRHGYVNADGDSVVFWDSDTDSSPGTATVHADVARWYMTVTGGAGAGTYFHDDLVACDLSGTEDAQTQGWEWSFTDLDFNDSVIEVTRTGGVPKPIGLVGAVGSSNQAARCDHVHTAHADYVQFTPTPTIPQSNVQDAIEWLDRARGLPPTAFITEAPDGAWIWFGKPNPVQHQGSIYVPYVDNSGNVALRVYDSKTGEAGAEIVLSAALDVDDHANPALLVHKPDNKLWAFYTRHIPEDTTIRLRISANSLDTDPTISGGFGSELSLDAALGGTEYTYPIPLQLMGETNDPVYLFYRDISDSDDDYDLAYSTTTASDGTGWAAQTKVYGVAGQHSYWKIASDGQTRIDFAINDGHPFFETTSLYHAYYQGGAWFKSDGSTAGSLPLDTSDLTEVWDGATRKSWVWDVVTNDGSPRIVFATFASVSDHRYHYAAYDGGWTETEVIAGGDNIYSDTDEEYYSGGMGLDHANPNVWYASVEIDGQWEIVAIVMDGEEWGVHALTQDSTHKNIRPVSVLGAAGDLNVMWLNGIYNTFEDYALGIQAARFWVDTTGGASGVTTLAALTDTTITSPAEGDTLRYVSGAWVNDNRRWEAVTDGADTFVWEGDALVHEWSEY